MKAKWLPLFLVIGWIGAAFPTQAAASPIPGQSERRFDAPKSQTWEACLNVLKGLPLAEADFEKGKIATEWVAREEHQKHFSFLGSVADLRCRYFVKVEEDNNGSRVTVGTRQEIQKYAGTQLLRRRYRPSDGKIEKAFLDQLKQHLEEVAKQK